MRKLETLHKQRNNIAWKETWIFSIHFKLFHDKQYSSISHSKKKDYSRLILTFIYSGFDTQKWQYVFTNYSLGRFILANTFHSYLLIILLALVLINWNSFIIHNIWPPHYLTKSSILIEISIIEMEKLYENICKE